MCGRAEQESGLRSRGKMQEGGGWREVDLQPKHVPVPDFAPGSASGI